MKIRVLNTDLVFHLGYSPPQPSTPLCLWWRGISAVRHAPLIEAAPPLLSLLPFTAETVA